MVEQFFIRIRSRRKLKFW